MRRIILDTDIGTDIDDMLCLTYLLKQKNCTLEGITTVGPESHLRAMLASSLCLHAGREDIEIYPGMSDPFFSIHCASMPYQAERLHLHPHKEIDKGCSAIGYLREKILANPGEITLMAIGPLTNVGALFASDPEIAEKLCELVIMGGSFLHLPDNIEYNIESDPYAAAIVFRSKAKIRCVGFDITRNVQMEADEFCAAAKVKALEPVLDYSAVWFEESANVTYHDPLAGAMIFDENICKFVQGDVVVDIDDKVGKTIFTENSNGRHFIVDVADRDKFIKHYFEVVGD